MARSNLYPTVTVMSEIMDEIPGQVNFGSGFKALRRNRNYCDAKHIFVIPKRLGFVDIGHTCCCVHITR